MRIRRATLAAFSIAASESFERRMLEYLRRAFPDVMAGMSDSEAIDGVRHGRERAGTFGVTSERGVCRWVHLMFMFGSDF